MSVFAKENNLTIKELATSQKKYACGNVLKDAKLKGNKKYECFYGFHMFLINIMSFYMIFICFFYQHNEFLYDLYMTLDQNNEFFHKENNLEIKELDKSRKKRRLRQRSAGREAQRK